MAITYSISGGADAAKFNIDSASGALTFKVAPDFEKPGDANGDNVYEVQVVATDSTGLKSTPKDMRVTVTDVSEGSPPQITSAGAVSVKENQTTVMTVTATDPDEGGGGGGGGTITLTPSGSITVGANDQIIEKKLITGNIVMSGKSGVIVRNCEIRHAGGEGLSATNCSNITVQDCKFVNTAAPTGQKPLTAESRNMIFVQCPGAITITRCTVGGACGVYGYECSGKFNVSFLEGHNMRSRDNPMQGMLLQLNMCTGGITMEDFSVENDPNNSWSSDNINVFKSSGTMVFRRGYIDGNNHPAGCGMMFESCNNAVVEDVDMIRMGNGGPGVFSGQAQVGGTSSNMTYRRIRIKDTIVADQGRGPPESGGCTYCSSPGTTNTKFEQCQHFNVVDNNLAWDVATMTVKDWRKADFTPRAAIRNKFGWE